MDNFSFVENPSQKHQSYEQETESTLKICFCTNRGAQDKKIRRFPRTLRKQTRDWKRIFGICDVMFGELVFTTIRDSEAFEKSSSLFQGFLKFIDYILAGCVKAMEILICGLEMSKYSRESSNHMGRSALVTILFVVTRMLRRII